MAPVSKFFNLLTDWDQYLSPLVEDRVPITGRNYMRLVGVIEMVVGAAVLKNQTRIGGYIASAWLLGIAANLVSTGKYFDIAARDVNMAVGAFALAKLTEARASSQQAEVRGDLRRVA